ncbi:MAG: hypothetical protein NZM18_02955 [Thermoflexales bacterium]|nr:hypothetical protein [Thermoflexales bacterium]MDW8350887.1 hypothetical protein [Anaerolineae bacterium]
MLISLLLFLIAFGAVLVLERFVHRRLQEVFLLLTGHVEAATLLYSLVLLPGVALHEVSHAAMAAALGVRVRRLSLRPERQRNGVVRLGYVEVLRSDALRTSLIGAAPLLAGLAALLLIGALVFDLASMQSALVSGSAQAALDYLLALPTATDSWLWIYVVFAIANSMMPSASDTQSWPPVIGLMVVLAAALLLAGGADLVTAIAPFVRAAVRWLTAVFALTAFIDVAAIVILTLAAWAIGLFTGRRVEFK